MKLSEARALFENIDSNGCTNATDMDDDSLVDLQNVDSDDDVISEFETDE